jgi:hypothetical protein
MSKFTFITQSLGYDGESPNSNPVITGINRRISFNNIPVDNPQTVVNDIGPGASLTIFNGSRTLATDGSTAFSLTLSPINPTTYRLLNTAGTAPVFRTDRGINVSTIPLTLSVGQNLALTITANTGSPFTAIQVGDTVFIPGITTGDTAGPFNTLNEGFWYVLTGGTSVITVARDPSVIFSGISEVVTPSLQSQLLAFSSDNVQVGDTLNLSLGFAASALHAYLITAVTPKWVEFTSTTPLGNQTVIVPTAAGIAIYTNAKRFVSIETEQEIIYQVNGDTGMFNKVTPLIAGTGNLNGTFYKWGTVWQLVIINHSTNLSKVTVCTVE